ncbi:ferredoxin-type protein NapF [Vibrio navarrensis]|uniref:Ferredoxin-type protein NapF n=1 Tax=Vibrio navarrensis TaxID=29495 RepID=A0AAI9G4S5_9VIBR|nr:ferredoxin-type protein NapF [Vibrio navarrensis]EJL6568030.1 ferredoxin-type protein NapF [Vibrio navarrensis]ELN6932389.1 ferredoxin-type protein NapF [Vibrio navarrensis]
MTDLSRRRFFTRHTANQEAVALPWLANRQRFSDECTRCGKCVSACETDIIVKGDGGFPRVDFTQGECTFCYQCAAACPEALFVSQENPPWSAKASIDDACLTKRNIECRSCAEACESQAISFSLQIGKVAQAQLNLDECNGCGACVSICPASSIHVSTTN